MNKVLYIILISLFSLTVISCSKKSSSSSDRDRSSTCTATDDDTTTTSYSGKFVAVGDNGTIATSYSLTLNNLTSKNLREITYGNNNLVTVGNSGTILTSTDDGTTWDNKTSGTTVRLRGITHQTVHL